MTQDKIKKEIRKMEKFYDYDHSIGDYNILVNLTEMAEFVSSVEKEAYDTVAGKIYLKLHRYLVENMLQLNLSPYEIDKICEHVNSIFTEE